MTSAVTPVTLEQPPECTSGEAESVFLPGGGEVETLKIGFARRMNFYLDGERVLTASEEGGRAEVDVTEYGLALAPERAAELRDEVLSHADIISAALLEDCDVLSSQADENAKCDLISIGAGILGGIAGGALGGVGSLVGAGAGYSLGALCSWLVAKICEGNPEGC